MNQNDPVAAELTNLEMLGLLASRIIHDLKNKLAVISGHAQFAEMTRQNPKAMSDAISIIKRVSEEAGKSVENMAKLRRVLPAEQRKCELAETVAAIENLIRLLPDWRLHITAKGVIGAAAIQPRWVAFLIGYFLQQSGAKSGTIEIDESRGNVPVEGVDVAPLTQESQFLRIRLCHAIGQEVVTSSDDPAEQLRALVVNELVRRLEGGLLQQIKAEGKKEITILIPLAAP